MSVTTYNQSPYFDDFNAQDPAASNRTANDKNFLRILFKPGAVQIRELNQMQSILQSQIDKFGQSIYKPGTPVIDGLSSFTDNVRTIDIDVSNVTAATYFELQKFIEVRNLGPYEDETLKAEILGYEIIEDSTHRVWVRYLNSTSTDTVFPADAEVYLKDDQLNLVDSSDTLTGDTSIGTAIATGIGFILAVGEGVFFVNGCFVHTVAQTKYFTKTSSDEFVNGNVVFRAVETIIDSADDQTLLDNANGTLNYAAPGADRYTIDLQLALRTDDEDLLSLNVSDVYAITGEESSTLFVNLLKISNSAVHTDARTEYSQLDRVLAERTYDESGNYTVNPFLVRVREFLKVDANNGRYTESQISTNDLYGFATAAAAAGQTIAEYCEQYLILEVEPSVAYVEGYRIALADKKSIPILKARASTELAGIYLTMARGNYVDIAWDRTSTFTGEDILDLFNSTLGQQIKNLKFLRDDNDFLYYRLFVYNDFDNSVPLDLFTGFDYLEVPGTYPAVEDRTLRSTAENKSIFKLPYSAVKGFASPGGIEYTKQKLYTGQVESGLTYRFNDSPYNAVERFTSTSAAEHVIFNATTGKLLSPAEVIDTVIPAPDATYVDITFNSSVGITSGNTIRAIIPVRIEDTAGTVLRRNKQVVSASETLSGSTKLTLANQDVIISTIVVTKNDIPANFSIIYDGQSDNFYESPVIRVPTTEEYEITYDYFLHATTGSGFAGDYFSADSYSASGVDYAGIPTYAGRHLTDFIDFRVKKLANGDLASIPAAIMPNSVAEASVDYYLPRYDTLIINSSDGEFSTVSGNPGLEPDLPEKPSGTMALYNILIPGYTFNTRDVKLEYIDNKRYTMRNIGQLERRISSLEYYTSLSLLEKEAADSKILDLREDTAGIERFKNGILVDSFIGHNVGNVKDPDYLCAIEPETGILRPYYTQKNFRLRYVKPSSPSIGQTNGHFVSLWAGAKEVLFSNLNASQTLSVQPFEVTIWEGSIKLSPSSDDWIDTETRPTVTIKNDAMADAINFIANNAEGVLGTKWNAWVTNWASSNSSSSTSRSAPHSVQAPDGVIRQRVDTTTTTTTTSNQSRDGIRTELTFSDTEIDLGERVVDMSIIPFIRSRDVAFSASGLKPNTSVFVFFDDQDVTAYAIQQSTFTLFGNSVDTDTYNGQFPTAWGVGWGTLMTDSNGDINGVLRIPNNANLQFRVGQRTIVITDSASNSSTESDTHARAMYTASGMLQTKETRIISTRTPQFSQERIQQNRTVVSTSTSSSTKFVDPVAQTFSIGNDHPAGVFLSDVDLYFATVPTGDIDVEIYLVSVENGIPTENVIPGSRVHKKKNQVIASGRTPTALPATNFAFDYPIYLQSGFEYAIIVYSPTPEYRVWVSELGAKDVISNAPITKNPSFGVLLKSQNAKTWTPDQLKDLMITLNKAVFPTNAAKAFSFTTLFPSNNTQGIDSFDFSLFNFMMDSLKLPGTSIVYNLEFVDSNNNSLLASGTYSSVKPKENYSLRAPFAPAAVNAVKVTAYLTTTNADLSPMIDLERTSLIGISNYINDDSTGEDDTDGGNALSRYITRSVQLTNPADEIRVIIAVNRPSSTSNIKVYAKRKPSASAQTPLGDIEWMPVPLLSVDGDQNASAIPVLSNSDSYAEVEYIIPNPDPNANDTPFEFSEFAIKIVMLSSDITKVPTIRDLRAIATL